MTKQTHFYLRDRNGHPIGVVAMRKEADGVRVAASLCAATDEWDKHVGVAKAVGRLESTESVALARGRSAAHVQSVLVGDNVTLGEFIDLYFPHALRINDIDHRMGKVWLAQIERLTTPRPA